VKSSANSCLARFVSVVPSIVHSPFGVPSRCRYFCVVFRFLCPTIILTVSQFCVLLSCFVM